MVGEARRLQPFFPVLFGFSLGSARLRSGFILRAVRFAWGSSLSRDCAGVVVEVRVFVCGLWLLSGSLWVFSGFCTLGFGLPLSVFSVVFGSSARAWRARCAFGLGFLGFCAHAVGWVRASFVIFNGLSGGCPAVCRSREVRGAERTRSRRNEPEAPKYQGNQNGRSLEKHYKNIEGILGGIK